MAAAELEKAGAQIKRAEANVNQAQINLDYTVVKAPISGRIAKTDVTRGNLVQNGTLLTTVVSHNLIWANFNISERDLLRLQRSDPQSKDLDFSKVNAYLQRSGDQDYPYEGHLDYIDPEVDQGTGTLAVRAIFQNSPDKPAIVPGLFVRVRVPIGTVSGAMLLPEETVGRDQAGAYVLTVGSEDIVERKNVLLGTKEGGMIVVTEGLSPSDMVVVVGLQRARSGAQVAPEETTLTMSEPLENQAVPSPEN